MTSLSGSNTPLKGLKVIIADDDPDMREIISEYFELAGAQVYSVESGERAFEVFQDQNRVDLIISDNRMPGMGGIGLLNSLRKLVDDLPPFILVTGNADQPSGDTTGLTTIVAKPFDVDHLLREAATAVGRVYLT